jgi:chromate transport protein ChrA
MGRSLTSDRERASLAFLAAIAVLTYPTAVGQVLIFVLAGLVAMFAPSFLLVVGALRAGGRRYRPFVAAAHDMRRGPDPLRLS